VANLVAHVPEHGAVGLIEVDAHALAVSRVGLVEIERDQPVGVAGGDPFVLA